MALVLPQISYSASCPLLLLGRVLASVTIASNVLEIFSDKIFFVRVLYTDLMRFLMAGLCGVTPSVQVISSER